MKLLLYIAMVLVVIAPALACVSPVQSDAYTEAYEDAIADGIVTPEEDAALDHLRSPDLPWDMIVYTVLGGGGLGTVAANALRNRNTWGTQRKTTT